MSWEPSLQLRVIDGEFEFSDTLHVLDQKSYELGRLPRDYEPNKNEILFREPTLSRVHATLTWHARKGGYLLRHKSNVNPTMVNERPVKKTLLIPGDQIQIGHLVLEVEEALPGAKSQGVDRTELLKELQVIVTETEQKYAHLKINKKR